jgi:hypothetical protein
MVMGYNSEILCIKDLMHLCEKPSQKNNRLKKLSPPSPSLLDERHDDDGTLMGGRHKKNPQSME